MNCTQIREKLLAWQYGELSPAEQAEVESHLAACAACRQESSAWQEFRGKLGAFAGPAVQVDLSGLYREAMQRNERRVRRWRRSALAAAAVAAIVLIGVALKLEVRVDATQLVLRWANPPKIEDRISKIEDRSADNRSSILHPPSLKSAPQVSAEDLQLVKDLVRVLAQEVQTRDRRQQEALFLLQARFETLLGQTYDHVAGNERDVAALYAAQFRLQKKGDNR
jgi:hypothetical protein